MIQSIWRESFSICTDRGHKASQVDKKDRKKAIANIKLSRKYFLFGYEQKKSERIKTLGLAKLSK
jgi:hypothetical protein